MSHAANLLKNLEGRHGSLEPRLKQLEKHALDHLEVMRRRIDYQATPVRNKWKLATSSEDCVGCGDPISADDLRAGNVRAHHGGNSRGEWSARSLFRLFIIVMAAMGHTTTGQVHGDADRWNKAWKEFHKMAVTYKPKCVICNQTEQRQTDDIRVIYDIVRGKRLSGNARIAVEEFWKNGCP